VLWILVVALSLFHLAQQMTLLGFSTKRPSVYVVPKLIHSASFLLLAVGVGVNFGLAGIASALAISSGVYFLLVYRANWRISRQMARSDEQSNHHGSSSFTLQSQYNIESGSAPTHTSHVSARLPPSDAAPRGTFTIVTPVFNMRTHLEDTINSVLNNMSPGDEYFIIDGGSTDGTTAIIEAYGPRLTGWISEADRGYAHAIQKGFRKARGELLCWINAGDLLLSGALNQAGLIFRDAEVDLIFGDDFYIDEAGKIISYSRGYVGGDLAAAMLYGGWTPLQDACFWTRELYERIGGIDPQLGYAADYDLFLRMALHGKAAYAPFAFSAFRRHPGQKSISGAAEYEQERRAVRQRELSRQHPPFILSRASSMWWRSAIRWRVHVTQRRWRRPDLYGSPIVHLDCRAYWPPASS
jgi:glycosyltransferase involved in cell wall biosynthesis